MNRIQSLCLWAVTLMWVFCGPGLMSIAADKLAGFYRYCGMNAEFSMGLAGTFCVLSFIIIAIVVGIVAAIVWGED